MLPVGVECVWQSASHVCSRGGTRRVCVPIEVLPSTDPRLAAKENTHVSAKKEREGKHPRRNTGTFGGSSFVEEIVLYKPDLMQPKHYLRDRGQSKRRFVYIDLGANTYASSIGNWMRTRYPQGSRFKVIAFEANPMFNQEYKLHPEVELLNMAAWTENTTLDFRLGGKKTAASGFIETAGRKATSYDTRLDLARRGTLTPAIDIADFLRRRVDASDYVVLKIDVEGAEYAILPHLLKSNVTHLIDEMFIEFHTEINTCCKPPNDKGKHYPDVLRLLTSLRNAGVYAHLWA